MSKHIKVNLWPFWIHFNIIKLPEGCPEVYLANNLASSTIITWSVGLSARLTLAFHLKNKKSKFFYNRTRHKIKCLLPILYLLFSASVEDRRLEFFRSMWIFDLYLINNIYIWGSNLEQSSWSQCQKGSVNYGRMCFSGEEFSLSILSTFKNLTQHLIVNAEY